MSEVAVRVVGERDLAAGAAEVVHLPGMLGLQRVGVTATSMPHTGSTALAAGTAAISV